MPRILPVLGALVTLGVPTVAAAAPATLPTVSRTLSASAAVPRTCSETAAAVARGVAVSSYRAPMSGYVTARLSAASGDWDLAARDAAGRKLATSSAFRSNEVVQTWVAAGDRIDFVACHRTGTARAAKLAISLVDVRPPAALGRVSVVRVTAGPQKLELLERAGLDVTHARGMDWADVLVAGAAQWKVLRDANVRATTRVADLSAFQARSRAADAAYTARVGAAGSPLPSGRTAYRSYDEIQNELKALAEQNKGLVKPVTLGQSFQGRDIQGLEIARDVEAEDGRPVFFLMGLHHAREWPAAEIPVEYATMLVKDQGVARVSWLLSRLRTSVVPVVNPDGYVSTRQFQDVDPAHNAGDDATVELAEAIAPPGGILAFRRKNCDGGVPDGAFPCELQWGVDNNRNYGNLWGGPGSSQDPTTQSYHGSAPRSEPETQAVWDYSRTHHVTTLISLHTIAALVLRPPGQHTSGLAPDENAMKELGDRMAASTGYTSQYGFQLYDTAGTTEDDTYAAEGGYGYTIEMGPVGGVFHGPYEDYVVKQWDKGDVTGTDGLRGALLAAADVAADRAHHGTIAGSAPAGAVLNIAKAFDTKSSPYCLRGLDPVIEPGFPGGDQNPMNTDVLPFLHCPEGVHEALTLRDRITTSMTVPASGSFSWDVNPSTRPFVGGGAIVTTLSDKPVRTETIEGSPANAVDGNADGWIDHTFEIKADDPGAVKIDLTWQTGEDYDVEVYRQKADGTPGTKVASSGNAPGKPEQLILSGAAATPGKYTLRIVYFAAATGAYAATLGYHGVTFTTTTGHPEAYTLTCESDGQTLTTRQVFIGRGETLNLDPCGSAAPAVVHPAADGTPVAGPPGPTIASSVGVKKAKKAKKKVTRAQVRKAQAACAKAKRAVRGKHGKKKGLAKYRAKRACANAAKLAKAYRKQHKKQS